MDALDGTAAPGELYGWFASDSGSVPRLYTFTQQTPLSVDRNRKATEADLVGATTKERLPGKRLKSPLQKSGYYEQRAVVY
jgi:hypothetical protein